ncbi:MAG: threonine synthase [Defluviitaleaceae bacterium]|nr:threonine synthase [Defluviitaleaceae bacterium]
MKCESTRSGAGINEATVPEAILKGLAPDGGLYVWDKFPVMHDLAGLLEKDNISITVNIAAVLLPGFSKEEIGFAVGNGYSGRFSVPELTPVVKVGPAWALELFHGPSLAFKDMALCVLPRLVHAAKKQMGDDSDTLVLVATSGDTGKAALEGFCGIPGCAVLVFFPYNGVSPLQELQMRTQPGANAVCAVRGNFDDTQRGVKQIFNAYSSGELSFGGVKLSSANSINIGRLVPQIAYYFTSYASLIKNGTLKRGDKLDFIIPTGNFGNILSGWIAKQMGLPVGRLVCASNENDVLTEFINTGKYDHRRDFKTTASPSMDIIMSSNLERLLYWLSGRDSGATAGFMEALARNGYYNIPDYMLESVKSDFYAVKCDDASAFKHIRRVWEKYGYLLDPHTAVAWNAYEEYAAKSENPCVVLATASPFKFAGSVLKALGITPPDGTFNCLDMLSRVTRIPVPHPFDELRSMRIRHEDTISIGEMSSYAQRFAGEING